MDSKTAAFIKYLMNQGANIMESYDYHKHCNDKAGQPTGHGLAVSTSNVAIIDFDVKIVLLTADRILKALGRIINEHNLNIAVVKTCGGGVHVYCLWDNSIDICDDSYTKAYTSDDYDVDVFLPYAKKDKNSRWVMLPGTKAKHKKDSTSIGEYKLKLYNPDFELSPFSYVIDCINQELNIDINIEAMNNKKQRKHGVHSTAPDGNNINKILKDAALHNDSTFSVPMTKDLFDTIIKGFDEHINIHRYTGNTLDEEVSIMPIVRSLNACIAASNEEVTQDDVFKALAYIHDHCKLTANADVDWNKIVDENKNVSNNHYGGLITIIKKYNSQYYDEQLRCFFNDYQCDPDDFINKTYTIDDFLASMHTMRSKNAIIAALVKCLAFVNNGKYIIKKRAGNSIAYEIVNKKERDERLSFGITIKETRRVTQDDVDCAVKGHRKKPVLGSIITNHETIKLPKLLSNADVCSKFKRYESAAVIGDDTRIFSLYRPPSPQDSYGNIVYNQELVDCFLKLIDDQLYDDCAKESFQHFLNINAYLLQQRKKANVFFVKYSATGETGKNYIDNAFSKMYGLFALTGITEQQLTEKHNGGMANLLYRSYDEFGCDNYTNKKIDNIVKRYTNDKMAVRAMNADTVQANDYAIDVLNTNDSSLYGMLRGDKALLSRLCIIRMKERTMQQSPYYKDVGVIDDESFGYSLYCYLMNIDLTEFIEQHKYSRYDIDKTNMIVAELREVQKSTLDNFLETIYDDLTVRRSRVTKEECDMIHCIDMLRLYQSYCIENGIRFRLQQRTLCEELLARGWTKKAQLKINGLNREGYVRKHVERIIPQEEEDEFEDI